jgi:type 1 fimbria pilin
MSPNVNNSIVKLSHLLKLYKADSMNKLILPTLSTLLLTLACTNVFAVDGTITVNGVVTDQTCILQGRGSDVSGNKDLMVTMPTVSKSKFNTVSGKVEMELKDATGIGFCDAATSYAFRGIHLSAISPTDLDADDKTLLVNKSADVSIKNPVFIRMYTRSNKRVDFSAPWETQEKTTIFRDGVRTIFAYDVGYVAKNWIVDAQNVQAKINYTMHYN